MTLNRKTHRAFNRIRENNFSLAGLLGFTLKGKTVGIIGTGKIGRCTARILNGFGCCLLAFDVVQHEEFTGLGGKYTSTLEELLSKRHSIPPCTSPRIHKAHDQRRRNIKNEARRFSYQYLAWRS